MTEPITPDPGVTTWHVLSTAPYSDGTPPLPTPTDTDDRTSTP